LNWSQFVIMSKQSRLLAIILAIVVGAVYTLIAVPPRLGLDLRGGAQLTLQAMPAPQQGINFINAEILESARYAIEQRVNSLGVSEATVITSGENQLVVQLPGVSDPQQAERVLGRTALLEFRKQSQGTESLILVEQEVQTDLFAQSLELEATGDQAAIAENEAAIQRSRERVNELFESTGLTGDYLSSAVAAPLGRGVWNVSLRFDGEGARRFAEITGELGGTGRGLGIFLDNELISAPRVGAEFQGVGITGGQASIEGGFSQDQAIELSLQLRSGALPVPVEIVENRTVGATLGADSVRSSIYAGFGGLVLVLLFMVVYYRLPGFVADIALIVYSLITLAIYSLFGVTLTLPGIAGFILSIGIAVDANILIFERTREELLAGKTVYKSVETGFSRAWSSILDSNITTLIACGALFWFGASLVKGFAVTLSIGVLVSMFTAVTCSRSLLLSIISDPRFRKPELYGIKSLPKSAGKAKKDQSASDKPKGASL
jgi:preprotein translocase subunit SecD